MHGTSAVAIKSLYQRRTSIRTRDFKWDVPVSSLETPTQDRRSIGRLNVVEDDALL